MLTNVYTIKLIDSLINLRPNPNLLLIILYVIIALNYVQIIKFKIKPTNDINFHKLR